MFRLDVMNRVAPVLGDVTAGALVERADSTISDLLLNLEELHNRIEERESELAEPEVKVRIYWDGSERSLEQ